jgi:hypothetical protein
LIFGPRIICFLTLTEGVVNQNFRPHLVSFPCARWWCLPSGLDGREGNVLSSCSCSIHASHGQTGGCVMCGFGRSIGTTRTWRRESGGCLLHILAGHRTKSHGMCARGGRFGGVWPVSAVRYSSQLPTQLSVGATCCWQRTAISGSLLRWTMPMVATIYQKLKRDRNSYRFTSWIGGLLMFQRSSQAGRHSIDAKKHTNQFGTISIPNCRLFYQI